MAGFIAVPLTASPGLGLKNGRERPAPAPTPPVVSNALTPHVESIYALAGGAELCSFLSRAPKFINAFERLHSPSLVSFNSKAATGIEITLWYRPKVSKDAVQDGAQECPHVPE